MTTTRKPGRPATREAPSVVVCARLEPHEADALRRWAKHHKLTRSAAARAAIVRGIRDRT